MSEVQAAVGLGQLEQLDAFLTARGRNTEILLAGLARLDCVATFPIHYGKARSACYCVNIMLPATGRLDRDRLILKLNAAGVGTSVHYPAPVPLMRYYREKYGYRDGQFPVAEWISAHAISLPVGPHVSVEDAQFIAETVAGIVAGSL
jgi:dTDP-4-amino-4,6-dideoxygalactose transaminase